ncbi:MAG: hypothetical protein EOP48_09580 [Sphingobacteriales bacterium]|nr:MAG: hypothetical protein EOP48_09580 [Sphingobacteriales bacterium]
MGLLSFITTNATGILMSIVANRLDAFIVRKMPNIQRWTLWLATFKQSMIRVSIAYLYRIEIDGRYLLIKGNRIDQFQPIGGVRKFHESALANLRELGFRKDDSLKIDEISRNDLRIRVPAKNLLKFLKWYETGLDREIDQRREFREELIKPGYLPQSLFDDFESQYLYTVPTFHYSLHFQCWELLYHEVYEPVFNSEQREALKELDVSGTLTWVNEELILSLGHDKRQGQKPFQIGEHTKLLVSKDIKLFKQ